MAPNPSRIREYPKISRVIFDTFAAILESNIFPISEKYP